MISFSQIKNEANYYLEGESYYTSDTQSQYTEWIGEGAKRLGLEGQVNDADLSALMDGKMPDGQEIGAGGNGRRRPGYDLTFSLPKSLSQLMLVGGDCRIYECFQKAVKLTLETVEADFAQARIRDKETLNYVKTGNLTIAMVNHFTSRALDPDGHIHALILNNTQTEDGKWRALASSSQVDAKTPQGFFEAMFVKRPYYEAILNAELAKGMRALGYTPEPTGCHSHFEVSEVPEEARRVQSKRRSQIEAALADYDNPSAKLADAITLSTRPNKQVVTPEAMQKNWEQELTESVNFSIREVAADRLKQVGLAPQTLAEYFASDRPARSLEQVATPLEKATTPALQSLSVLREKLTVAIERLSTYQVSFSPEQLFTTLLQHNMGEQDLQSVQQLVAEALQSGELEALPGSNQLTTAACIEREVTFMEAAKTLAQQQTISCDSQALSACQVSTQQVIGDNARLRVVLLPQANQSHLMETLLNDAKDHLHVGVQLLMPSRLNAEAGNTTIQRPGKSLFQRFVNQLKGPPCETVSGYLYRHGGKRPWPMQKPPILLVEEANRLPIQDAKALIDQANRQGSTLIFLAQQDGLHSRVGADCLTLLEQAGVKPVTYNDPTLAPDNTATVLITNRQVGLPSALTRSSLVITDQKRRVSELNVKVREQLRENGEIGEKDWQGQSRLPVYIANHGSYQAGQQLKLLGRYEREVTITHVDTKNGYLNWQAGRHEGKLRFKALDAMPHQVYTLSSLAVAERDRVRATMNDRDSGLVKGRTYEILSLTDRWMTLRQGKSTVRLSARHEHLPLVTDYVRTCYDVGHGRFDQVVVDVGKRFLSANLMNRLSDMSTELTVITDNPATCAKRLENLQTRQTLVTRVNRSVPTMQSSQMTARTVASTQQLHPLLANCLPTEVKGMAREAMSYALDKALEHEAGCKLEDLVKYSLDYVKAQGKMGELDQATVKQSVETLIAKHYLISHPDKALFTTPALLEQENRIIHTIEAGKGALDKPCLPNFTAHDLPDTFSDSQKQAALLVAATRDRFVALPGFSGTGKSTLWGVMREKLADQATPIELLGLAPTHEAVRGLREKGIETQTLQSFLQQQRHEPHDLRHTLIILDEASQVSNANMDALIQIIHAGNGQGVFQGDTTQYLSIESAKIYHVILSHSNIDRTFLKDIQRQSTAVMQTTVAHVIDRDPAQQLATLKAHAPTGIARTTVHLTDEQSTSLVDVDTLKRCAHYANDLKPDPTWKNRIPYDAINACLADALIQDYLTRTDAIQATTCIIVPTHEDAAIVNQGIRAGLIEAGRLPEDATTFTKLIPRTLDQADLRLVNSYHKGDIAVVYGHYYQVVAVKAEQSTIVLANEEGERNFYPRFHHKEVALYHKAEKDDAQLGVGDRIRLTQTDRAKDRIANASWQVTAIDKDGVSIQRLEDGKQDYLRRDEWRSAHWTYDYCMTGFSSESKSMDHVIMLAPAWRRLSVNDRFNLVAITRARESVIVYTNDHSDLISRVSEETDKHSAREVSGIDGKPIVVPSPTFRAPVDGPLENNPQPTNLNPVKSAKPKFESLDISLIKANLAPQIASIVEGLLGQPNHRLSNADHLRYGNKGSLSIALTGNNAGIWKNFETGEKGDILTLIQQTLGFTFKEALDYANQLGGGYRSSVRLTASKPEPTPDTLSRLPESQSASPINTMTVSVNMSDAPRDTKPTLSRTQEYAKTLLEQSQPIQDTLAWRYLQTHRGIKTLPNTDDLRFHPHVSTGVKIDDKTQYAPALLAIARLPGTTAPNLQAIYLNPETASKLDTALNKRTYGTFHTEAGHHHCTINEGSPDTTLTVIAEGVETALSLKEAMPQAQILCTLGKDNMLHIEADQLKSNVILALDYDRQSPHSDPKMQHIIAPIIHRLTEAGHNLYTVYPHPDPTRPDEKLDFNDLLREGGKQSVDAALMELQRIIPQSDDTEGPGYTITDPKTCRYENARLLASVSRNQPELNDTQQLQQQLELTERDIF